MGNKHNTRDMDDVVRRNRLFWDCGETDRPLIGVTYDYMLYPEVTASAVSLGEVMPDHLDIGLLLAEYEKNLLARNTIGDDIVAAAAPVLGMPWLEAMCGCRVLNADGNSLWPEPPPGGADMADIRVSWDNPWLTKLLQVLQILVERAAHRYPISISHLRGPADVLVALLGSDHFFLACYDDPDRLARLGRQVAELWIQVVRAQQKIIPPYLGGYAVLEFDLWAPGGTVYLQDDTSGMISLKQYRSLFMDSIQAMAFMPYSAVHLHIPSLHLAEEFSQVRNVRCINCSCDSQTTTFQDALPTLRRLQERNVPLVLNKYVQEGFSLEEYEEILDGLSPAGVCVHLRAGSVEEGQAVMAYVRERARKGRRP
ncbi:MAG: hypothetical protein M1546_01060 [Chloroflexi bacterium]|nr:hypothetical protein [Chloroflexota bacterium]